MQTWLAEPQRTQPWVCVGGDFDETAQSRYHSVRVTDLPVDASVDDDFFDTPRLRLELATRVLQITRRLHTKFAHQVCSADMFNEVQASLGGSSAIVVAGGGAGHAGDLPFRAAEPD